MRSNYFRFLMVLLLIGTICHADDPPASPGPIGSRSGDRARGTFRVTSDPTSSASDFKILRLLMHDKKLLAQALQSLQADPAIRVEAFGHTEEPATIEPNCVRLVSYPADADYNPRPGTAILGINVVSTVPKVSAESVIQSLGPFLEKALEQIDERKTKPTEIERLTELVESNEAALAKRRKGLYELGERAQIPTDPALAATQRANLSAQISAAEVAVEGLTARREALEQQIEKLAKETEHSIANDPVIKELQMAIDLRRRILLVEREKLQKAQAANKKGLQVFSEADLEKAALQAESDVAGHQAELAKYRYQATLAAGGSRIAELRGRLEDTDIELAEKQAQRKTLQRRARNPIELVETIDQMRLEIEVLERSHRGALEELNRVRQKAELYAPPQVTLMSSAKIEKNPKPAVP